MKLLQNPVVVIVLAGLALGLVLKNAVLPMIKRGGGGRPQTRAAATAAKAATVAVKSEFTPSPAAIPEKEAGTEKSESSILPSADIALAEVSAASMQWTASPRRDPFHFERKDGDGPSARDLLKLSGIWRQTSSTLAVLNNRVIHEGESILGFTVETVESDRVWVQGPNGRESLEFKFPVPEDTKTLSEPPKGSIAAAE